jgi:hypothetical protein
VTIAAAGDIACDPSSGDFRGGAGSSRNCRQKATSDLALALDPTVVLPLGDLQYESGTAAAFRASYQPSWGRLRAISRPAVGNHEYNSGAGAYWDYFGSAAGPAGKGWYSYDLGAWHLVALNSNCGKVGCGAGSEQVRWLRADLAAHRSACTLAYWHHPRWSDGEHGDDGEVAPFVQALYEAGADVVLNGHDHDYERFVPRAASGAVDRARGIREFVVGTGGKNHYQTHANPLAESMDDSTYGVLSMTLRPGGYSWRFVPEQGRTFTDAGSAACH